MSKLGLAAALALLAAAPAGAQEGLGSFQIQEGKDALTGQPVVAIATPSHEDGPNVGLMWRCAPGPEIVLSFLRMQVLASDPKSPGAIAVHWWFDRGPEREAAWSVESGGQRLALPETERTGFTELARTSRELFVRFEGSPEDRPTYSFDLAGAPEALAKVGCHGKE